MRGVFGLIAVLMLTALSQPAWATCVYRALVKTCTFEKHGFWKDDLSPPVDVEADPASPNSIASNTTAPSASVPRDNAWVVTPSRTNGAIVVRASGSAAQATEAACTSESGC